MPEGLKGYLKDTIDGATSLLGFLGWGSVVAFAFALPELGDPIAFFAHFASVGSIIDFVKPRFLELFLMAVTLNGYRAYRKAVLREIDVINASFLEELSPVDANSIYGKKYLPFMGVFMVGCFIALAISVQEIQYYCQIALILNVFDTIGNHLVGLNLSRVFGQFPIPTGQGQNKHLSSRRQAASDYFLGRPLVLRSALSFLPTIAALSIAVDSLFGLHSNEVAYLIMISTHICSEILIGLWRGDRDRRLLEIDKTEHEENATLLRLGSQQA